ncbi:MAG: outer membrane lipoprotein-sorting protein [Chitinophagales bacterium]|nr:outer membrane lipoprotein-sorting protein [Chitinophagales bacterium]
MSKTTIKKKHLANFLLKAGKKIVSLSSIFIMLFIVQAKAQTADDIINKYLTAIGGKENVQKIQSIKQTGKLDQGGTEIPGIMYQKRPDMMRTEFTFQGKTGLQVFNGTDGWDYNPFQGRDVVEKMNADELKDVKFQADIDGPLVDYAKKGYKVDYIGDEDFNGTQSYKLKLTSKEGDEYSYFIDKESNLLLGLKQKVKTKDGSETESETNLSDYKEVNGVLMPFTIENKANYQGQSFSSFIKIDSIKANSALEDSFFQEPKIVSK